MSQERVEPAERVELEHRVTALELVAAVLVALIAYEAIRYRSSRAWIRSHRGALTLAEARRNLREAPPPDG